MGPVAVSAAALLLLASPLMRGGNRQVALIALEAVALFFLLSLWLRAAIRSGQPDSHWRATALEKCLLAVLLLSPLWLAIVYLAPLPATFWSGLPGRGEYLKLLSGARIAVGDRMPLSLVPDATMASLLAGLPLVAAFTAAYVSRLPQLKLLVTAVVIMGFMQVGFGLLQAAGGSQSSLYFTTEFAGRPFGTFANTNHFANYIGLALAGYIWLAGDSLLRPSSRWAEGTGFARRHAQAFWISGGLILVLGILMTWSRGAAVSVLPAAMLAAAVVCLCAGGSQNWRMTLILLATVVVVAVSLIGAGALLSRFDLGRMAADASFRGLLASSTLAGAGEFWPWGAGWGTYAAVYPRFQPVRIDGFADYAHQDYAQMLLEGGVFSVVLAAAFLWLAIGRAARLTRAALTKRGLQPDELAAAVCGVGLLGFLLHSLVEFNMHIPANAIVAAMLAGAFLRPLRQAVIDR